MRIGGFSLRNLKLSHQERLGKVCTRFSILKRTLNSTSKMWRNTMILWLIGQVSCMLTRSQLGIVWTQKDISLKEIIDNVASDFFQQHFCSH